MLKVLPTKNYEKTYYVLSKYNQVTIEHSKVYVSGIGSFTPWEIFKLHQWHFSGYKFRPFAL